MSYIQPENSNRVNSIKQRFESKLDSTGTTQGKCEQVKESLCRTLSASPVAPRKNLKLNVVRQLSNPGRNIKRSPAFRGDKLTRTKNLISPTKEKTISLVDKNVKLFQEKPEYGKLGNVKKKDQENLSVEQLGILYDDVYSINLERLTNGNLSPNRNTAVQNDLRCSGLSIDDVRSVRSNRSQSLDRANNSVSPEKTNECNDKVRTTVISRHKNISSLPGGDNGDESIYGRLNVGQTGVSTDESPSSMPDKFLKNGVEYTKVLKSKPKVFNARKITIATQNQADETDGLLKFANKSSAEQNESDNQKNLSSDMTINLCEIDLHRANVIHVSNLDDTKTDNNDTSTSFCKVQQVGELKLTDTLKAALKAPLPPGPPPKKPPRTFAHSPITNRSPVDDYEEVDGFWQKQKRPENDVSLETLTADKDDEKQNKIRSFLHDVSSNQSRKSSRDHAKRLTSENWKNENVHDQMKCSSSKQINCKTMTSIEDARKNLLTSSQTFKTSPVRLSTSARRSKDSKEMLDKLEHVLTQHQKACGPKVIIPRMDKFHLGIGDKVPIDTNTSDDFTCRNQKSFQNRLSRTLEDGRKMMPLPKIPDSPVGKRNLAFDCLPSLNCASSSVYEQIENPDFKTYLTELSDNKTAVRKKFENVYNESAVKNSHFYFDANHDNTFHLCKTEPYDTLMLSPGARRLSTELTTFTDAKKQSPNEARNYEHIYARPHTFDKRLGTDVIELGSETSAHRNIDRFLDKENCSKNLQKGKELHYMCTPIPSAFVETNNNHFENELTIAKKRQGKDSVQKSLSKSMNAARPSPDKFDKTKIEELLDQAFGQPVMAGSETPTDSNTSSDTDSLTSSTSNTDEYPTFNDRLQIFKDKEKADRATKAGLKRSVTEKRKHYVKRVSSRYSENKEGLRTVKRNNLFDICLLVELNLSTKKPYIKEKYPFHATSPAWIENFCFPDALDWPPAESDQDQAYTFVLTDEVGNRRYGYCRRVKPEGAPVCLPLAYCLITKHRASGFYFTVLTELESRHGQPDIKQREFIERLYNSTTPQPGEALRLQPDDEEAFDDSDTSDAPTNNNVLLQTKISEVPTSMTSEDFLNLEKSYADELSNGSEDLDCIDGTIIRLGDHRLEEKDMSQLFDSVSTKVLLLLFSSLLLERKVVLISSKLSKLSSCVEALQSLLYPFSWPHPFIPFLPNIPEFSEILQAPSPFVIGILRRRNGTCIDVTPLEDGIVVDLDNSKVISAVGDESSILPSRIQKGLKSALQIVSNNTKSKDGLRNYLVSEAFLRVFVQTCAHYESHIAMQQDGTVLFEKESFVKATPMRNVEYFLDWFVETTMFNQLVQDRVSKAEGLTVSQENHMKLFHLRVAEYLIAADKNSQSKKGLNKKKTLGDRLKDLTNFN